MGCTLQMFAELGGRDGDQVASSLSGTAPEQHRPAILGDHLVDVRPGGSDRRTWRQRGHDARDLSINRREPVWHVAWAGLGCRRRRRQCQNWHSVWSIGRSLEKSICPPTPLYCLVPIGSEQTCPVRSTSRALLMATIRSN